MTKFRGDRCGEEFSRRDSLARHKVRKIPCNPDMSNSNSRSFSEKRRHIDGDSRQPSKHLKIDRNPSSKRVINEEVISTTTDVDIPTLDGAEFSGTKPKSRETLHRMMEVLKIPDHRRERIATEILKEDRERARTRTDLSNFINEDEIDESAGEGDVPLNESDLIELLKRYKTLQSDLIQKGRRQNVPELLSMLNVLLESDVINQADYVKMNNRIKGYL